MKAIAFFTVILLPLFTGSFIKAPSYIDWSASRKLTWADFKGTVPPRAANAALTNSSIGFDMGYGNNGFTYAISCRFDPEKSWGRVKTDLILKHEQAHFDITEIHARKLYQAFRNYTFNEKTVEKDVNEMYDRIMKLHQEMQHLYDAETEHSINTREQARWLAKIAAELKSLAAFAQYPKRK